jgi:anti-sigma regulatory factor (Ser/Thr protein kinase)
LNGGPSAHVPSDASTNGDGFEKYLPRSVIAPRLAREVLGEWFEMSLAWGELESAKLAVSELVTNAITHGCGEVVLRATLGSQRLRVEVSDEGSGFTYRARTVDSHRLQGYGLAIVEATVSRWGFGEFTTRVWFELDRGRDWRGRSSGSRCPL